MRLNPAILLLLTGVATLPAQEPVRKDGAYWLKESKGHFTTSGASRLKIVTHGAWLSAGFFTFHYSLYVGAARRRRLADTGRLAHGQARRAIQERGRMVSGGGLRSADVLAELTIHVPAGLRQYVVDNRAGPISVRGLNGDVHVVTASGNIDMDAMGANVIARTGGGSITFGNVKGSLRCLTGGGTVRVAKIGAESVLESAGGEIWIEEAAGRSAPQPRATFMSAGPRPRFRRTPRAA